MRLPFFRRPVEATISSGNVFADLGLADADELFEKSRGLIEAKLRRAGVSRSLPPYATVDRWMISAVGDFPVHLSGSSVTGLNAFWTADPAAARLFGSIDDAGRLFRRLGLVCDAFRIVPAW